ncbi:hypothetical protein TSAR_003945 [Trichomalopsis sarcophagae]|uniref:Uncharacterized protein n=1 Tax=Trichomalopsis sarcophagae TaxID=543379 RepID=A0A232ET91_9HYME|nr:hypothetical protein TSAR_003945 [Trichomalopsis sarcophagae]
MVLKGKEGEANSQGRESKSKKRKEREYKARTVVTKDPTSNPVDQGDRLTVLKDTIRRTIEYAEGRTNEHETVRTHLTKAMKGTGKKSRRKAVQNHNQKEEHMNKLLEEVDDLIVNTPRDRNNIIERNFMKQNTRYERNQVGLFEDAILANIGSKRSRGSLTNSPEEKSRRKQDRQRQRQKKAAMQRETLVPRVPHNVPQPLTKVRSNKNKRPEKILVKVGQNKTYAEVL